MERFPFLVKTHKIFFLYFTIKAELMVQVMRIKACAMVWRVKLNWTQRWLPSLHSPYNPDITLSNNPSASLMSALFMPKVQAQLTFWRCLLQDIIGMWVQAYVFLNSTHHHFKVLQNRGMGWSAFLSRLSDVRITPKERQETVGPNAWTAVSPTNFPAEHMPTQLTVPPTNPPSARLY